MAAKRPQGRRSRRRPLRRRSRHPACSLTADCLAHQPKQRLTPRRLALLRAQGYRSRRSCLRRRSRHLSCILTAARAASQAGRRRTQPAILSTDATNPGRGAIFPAAVRRHGWQRDGGRCCYRDPLSGRRYASSHFLQIDHLLPVAQGGGADLFNYIFSALPITACATATGRLRRRIAPSSASSALLARALDSARRRLAGGRGRAGHPSHRRAPNVHLRCRIIRPWPWSPVYEPPASGDRHHRQRSALQHR